MFKVTNPGAVGIPVCIFPLPPVSIIRISFLQENRSPNKVLQRQVQRFRGINYLLFQWYIKLNSSLSLISKVEFVIDNLWWTLFLVCDVMKREPHIAVLLLLSSSSLSSIHKRPVRLTEEVLRQGIATLFGKLAD